MTETPGGIHGMADGKVTTHPGQPIHRGSTAIWLVLAATLAAAMLGPVSQAFATESPPPPLSEAVNATAEGDELPAESSGRLVDTHGEPMTFKGGYVQHHPHVYAIFWGSDWNNQSTARELILNLYKTLPGSNYGAILTQYFDYSGPISNDTALTSFTDTRSAHPGTTTETNVREEVHYAIEHDSSWKAAWEAPSRYENQYVVFTPPLTKNGATEGCGYHGWMAGSWQNTFTYIPWPAEGCQRGLGAGNTMQVIASHEWAETATDPVVSNSAEGMFQGLKGWAWGEGGEIGDICQTLSAAEHKEIASNVFAQTLYDNYMLAANGTPCVASDPTPQRFTVGMGPTSVSTASHNAMLWGQLSPAGWTAGYRFELTGPGGTTFLPNRAGKEPIYPYFPPSFENAGNGPELFQNLAPAVLAEGLKGNTTYGVRFATLSPLTLSAFFNFASASSALFSGSTSFTTPDWRPQVTGPSQDEVKAGHATLSASINPEGYETTYRFEWGKTTSYGSSIPAPDANVGSGTSNLAVEQKLEGLKGQTEYHYRLVATNAEGTTTSADKSFTTPDWRPVVTPEAQTEVKVGHALLHGKVNPRGFATHYHFEWGTKAEFEEGKYGHLVPVPDAEIGSGESDVSVSQTIEGLKGQVNYHYRLVAENVEGTTTSADKSFTTPDWRPWVYYSAGVGVKATEATLVTRISPQGFATTYHLEWATDAEFKEGKYGHTIAGEAIGSGEEAIEITKPLTGLKPRQTYHFRAIAENSEGARPPIDATFTTSTSGFIAGQYPTSLEGVPTGGNFTESFGGGISSSCTPPNFTAKLEKTGTEFYSGGAEILPTTSIGSMSCSNGFGTFNWEMNGCRFEFDPGYGTKGSFEGEFDIGPPGCGPITTNIGYCPISIPPQIGRAATYTNEVVGNGEERVNIALNIHDLRYSSPGGGGCAKQTNAADGWLSGTWQMTAKGLKVTPAFEVGPELTTEGASGISATAATMHGTIDTGGYGSYYGFEYGLTVGAEYESVISGGEIPAGVEGPHAKELTASNLKPGKTYHYRMVALDANGVSRGEDKTFTTAPGTITEGATALSANGATLHGSIDPAGSETSYQFEYGPTTSYGAKAPASPKAIGAGKEFVAVSEPITGLSPSSTYHFRVASTNSEGTTYGEDQTFITWGSWSTQTTPNVMQSTPETKLEDVSCASSSMCMAVGTDLYTGSAGKGVGQLWNGTEWKTVFSGINATPTAIDCPTTTSCLAVGTSNESTWVERWSVSGGTWSKAVKLIELPSGATKATLRDISCTSETACTAVGSYFDGTKMVALAERYTGSLILSTQTTASLSEYGEFSGVSCDGASSCTAVGRKGSGSSLLAERWNGSEWSLLSTPAKPEESGANEFNLERVSCPSASFCMAVGSYKKELARWAFAERWNGTSWSIQATPKPTGTKSTALLGVSCSSSSACAAVGRNVTASGTGEFLTTEEKTLAYSWGGSEWQLQSSTNPEGKKLPRLTGISCSASNACTAVGWATKGKGELPTVTLGERYE